MHNNLIFVGGIHGVGKGTLCHYIANELRIIHLTASEVLKWQGFNDSPQSKLVKDVSITQDKLIQNLNTIVSEENDYILDGHFCLLNKTDGIEKVSQKIFEQISPIAVILVCEQPGVICRRLDERDAKEYDLSLITEMQKKEIAYAREICHMLDVELLEITSDEKDIAVSFCRKMIANK